MTDQTDNPQPNYVYDASHIDKIMLIGAGGTGSYIAANVARLLWHLRETETARIPDFYIVDHDVVERKNVGRQNFEFGVIGTNKAQVLAQRYNRAYGLEIRALAQPIQTLNDGAPSQRQYNRQARHTLMIGAVDNHMARQAIRRYRPGIWIDCGNSFDSGQVVVGTTHDANKIQSMAEVARYKRAEQVAEGDLSPVKLDELPDVSLIHPDILQPPTDEDEQAIDEMSCADIIAADSQSLYINQTIACLASEYIRTFVNRNPITSYRTYFNGDKMAMTTFPVEPTEIANRLHMPVVAPRETGDIRLPSASNLGTSMCTSNE